MMQTEKKNLKEEELYKIDSIILSQINFSEDFEDRKENLLKNAFAILYSYLRPLVAQMTVLAKLPPLDLPPANFSEFDIEIAPDLDTEED